MHGMHSKLPDRINILLVYFSTDEDPSLRIESSAIINLRGVILYSILYSPCKHTRNLELILCVIRTIKFLLLTCSVQMGNNSNTVWLI